MGRKINLLKRYPSSKRNVDRIQNNKKKYQKIARKFDKRFFDGSRLTGYGGYYYNKKFWYKVTGDFIKYYKIKPSSKILDVGCGKGFMLYDFKKHIPKLNVYGIDISKYAILNSLPKIKKYLQVSNCKSLPFDDNYFDLVISINTIHNLNKRECAISLKEISRVSKGKSFVTVDAYRNKIEKERMFKWNLTAKTIMSDKDWVKFFKKNGYNGDYYWFVP
jgi:ubiquinone/menaquinone biosynthesis C-methylase UbiE